MEQWKQHNRNWKTQNWIQIGKRRAIILERFFFRCFIAQKHSLKASQFIHISLPLRRAISTTWCAIVESRRLEQTEPSFVCQRNELITLIIAPSWRQRQLKEACQRFSGSSTADQVSLSSLARESFIFESWLVFIAVATMLLRQQLIISTVSSFAPWHRHRIAFRFFAYQTRWDCGISFYIFSVSLLCCGMGSDEITFVVVVSH